MHTTRETAVGVLQQVQIAVVEVRTDRAGRSRRLHESFSRVERPPDLRPEQLGSSIRREDDVAEPEIEPL
ncbi:MULTISPECIES: hypothetical protein [unclassified Dietzia]|uniref:hypothetical protein n=1 Tax=unclassified Dietzia TaxID=2617939 RepID=UPI000849187D|nr:MULTISPECIES: hypothetical protein [unclassified Dietzia]MBB0991216.1 hypothetical protein [Dietzia sp. SLG510A3-30A2]MBB1032518.1 hypothetical protein [Dietzia sp. SLG310A2-38A2]ODQ96992.1 hypothetical protein BFG51_11880 [Dietzia alimentaria]MBB1040002.1 hypothetical protein [Dietzia sp. Cai40]MBB1055758.1 hypothetical protein [Dietzia sp. B44]